MKTCSIFILVGTIRPARFWNMLHLFGIGLLLQLNIQILWKMWKYEYFVLFWRTLCQSSLYHDFCRDINIGYPPWRTDVNSFVRNYSIKCSYRTAVSITSTVRCRHVSTRVNEFHATPSSLSAAQSLTGILWSCDAEQDTERSFPASAPLIWNSLPTTVRDFSTSMTSFGRRLKAELFRRAYGTDLAPMWQLSVNSLREHKYSYLLT